MSILFGQFWNQIDFTSPTSSFTIAFDTHLEFHNFLFSLIDFVNRNSISLQVRQIRELRKIYNSYQWPFKDEELQVIPNNLEMRELLKEEIMEIRILDLNRPEHEQELETLIHEAWERLNSLKEHSSEEYMRRIMELNLRKLAKQYRRFSVAITKHDNHVFIKAIVWEHGVCYYLTNMPTELKPDRRRPGH
jgi:hypothetical protein